MFERSARALSLGLFAFLAATVPGSVQGAVPAGPTTTATPPSIPTAAATVQPRPPAPRPFRMLAIGDSVMWGQGLSEPHKFASLVRDWVQAQAGTRQVVFASTAHSGATVSLGPGVASSFDTFGPEPGEIPTSFPTILRQVQGLAPALVPDPAQVDLVLIDGAANDVGLTKVPDPRAGDVSALLSQKVLPATTNLLNAVMSRFPNALIVMTGYYRPVSPLSDPTNLTQYLQGINVPIVGSTTPIFDRVQRFYDGTNSLFQSLVDTANQAAHTNRVVFVKIPWADDMALGAPASMVWRPLENDEVRATRLQQCAQAATMPRPPTEPFTMFLCQNASMIHPNVAGAMHYAMTIEDAIGPRMCDVLGLKRMNATMTPSAVNRDGPTTVTVHAVDATTNASVSGGSVRVVLRGMRGVSGPTDTRLTTEFLRERPLPGGGLASTDVRATVFVDAPGYCTRSVPFTFAAPTLTVAKALVGSATFTTQRRASGAETFTIVVKDAATQQPVAATVKIGTSTFSSNTSITYDVCTKQGVNVDLVCAPAVVTAPGYPSITVATD